WKAGWDACIFIGSLVPAIMWGVAFANIVRGVPLNAAGNYTGNLITLLNPYGLLGGLTTLALFTAQGARFLELKTGGVLRSRARAGALIAGRVSIVAGGGFLAWTMASYRRGGWSGTGIAAVTLAAVAAVALITAVSADRARRGGIAFTASSVAIGSAVGALFT